MIAECFHPFGLARAIVPCCIFQTLAVGLGGICDKQPRQQPRRGSGEPPSGVPVKPTAQVCGLTVWRFVAAAEPRPSGSGLGDGRDVFSSTKSGYDFGKSAMIPDLLRLRQMAAIMRGDHV